MQTDDVVLRVSVPADEAAVTALLRACYPPLLAMHYDAALLAQALPAMTKANPRLLAAGTYYVAQLASGALVGCGGWTADRPGSGEEVEGLGHIRHFATHPKFTRRRIGTQLLKRCFADARIDGRHGLECYSTLGAQDFYASAGFEFVERVDVDLPGNVRFPAVLMKCRDLHVV